MVLRSLSFVDINADPKPLYDLPVFVSQGLCATHLPTINTVRSPQPMLNFMGVPTGECLRKFLDDISLVPGVNGFKPSPASYLIQGHSKIVTRLPVDESRAAIGCHRPEERRKRVHHSLHLLLRLLESDFRGLLGSRIEHDSVKRESLSGVIADSRNAGVKPSVLPVSAHEAMDGVISKAFREQSIPKVYSFLKIIWVEQIDPTLLLQILNCSSAIFNPSLIDVDERSVWCGLEQNRGEIIGKEIQLQLSLPEQLS